VLSVNPAGLRLLDAKSAEDLRNVRFFSLLSEEHQGVFVRLAARVFSTWAPARDFSTRNFTRNN
jgi:hypothetical protein